MRTNPFMFLLILVFSAIASTLHAQESSGGPLFMKDLVGDREFYEPWGIGIDIFNMDQQYSIKSLQFDLPGVDLPDPSLLSIENDIQHIDIKLDVWLTPFLNAFVILGHIDADTLVDFSQAPITGLPVPLKTLPISYDGTVYGGGLNLVYGSDRWFTALNATWTDTSLSGDFDSSVSSFALQPRVGLVRGGWQAWVGGMYLDTDETHSGTITLPIPGIPPVDFAVDLEGSDKWNTAVGVGYTFSPKATLLLEIGFGDRDYTLFNFAYRF